MDCILDLLVDVHLGVLLSNKMTKNGYLVVWEAGSTMTVQAFRNSLTIYDINSATLS